MDDEKDVALLLPSLVMIIVLLLLVSPALLEVVRVVVVERCSERFVFCVDAGVGGLCGTWVDSMAGSLVVSSGVSIVTLACTFPSGELTVVVFVAADTTEPPTAVPATMMPSNVLEDSLLLEAVTRMRAKADEN